MQDRYREVYDSFKWEVPARFNIGTACCGRHSPDRSRFALYWEDEAGSTAAYTFWDLQQHANRLSNALAGLGVKRGDRVGIILPQRPETAIAHIACYQMGVVAVRMPSNTVCRTVKLSPRSSIPHRCPVWPRFATSCRISST